MVFGRAGDGHTAARHFVRMHLAQLRFQNPDASVSQSSSKLEKSSRVSIELDGGEAVELNVTGLANRTEARPPAATPAAHPCACKRLLVRPAGAEAGARRVRDGGR